MNDPLETLVHTALARYLGTQADQIRPAHDLLHDLKLYPLDLVFFVLRLEEILQADITPEHLFDVHTVADLMKMLDACVRGRSPAIVGADSTKLVA